MKQTKSSQKAVSDITKQLADIKEKGNSLHPLRQKIIENALKNLQHAFSSSENIMSFDDTKLLLWEYAINSAHHEIFAFATDRQAKSGYGFSPNKKLLDIQRSVIDRGVKIHRIFSVEKEQYQQFSFLELLRLQLKAKITVWVAPANVATFLASQQENDQENYIIVDDKLLYRSFVEDGQAKNSITFNPQIIKNYTKMFNELRVRSYQFTQKDLPKSFEEI